MALGELTKQLAEQAILAASKPGAPPAPDRPGPAVLAQVQAMQRALKEDEELVVLFHTGGETVRVMEFFVPPSWQVVVLNGLDPQRNVTRAILPADSLQLVCKVMKAPAGARPARVNFVLPKG